jgi:hypothetical protein
VCGDEKDYVNIVERGDRRKRESIYAHNSMITMLA